MGKRHLNRIYSGLILLIIALGYVSCGSTAPPPRKQLLIYCGITMIKPLSEIARVIERRHDCEIIITKGGSGNLLKAINASRVGDLYLPGSESYIETCVKKGLVVDFVHVGYNKAAMMVRKGNPKGIGADLANLLRTDLTVVIGNPNSGSIGKETKRILQKRKIFDSVISNAHSLTTDSKDLAAVLRNGSADLVVNWYAISTWPENKPYLDVLSIDEKYATKEKLVLGLLKTSKNPKIARALMEYAASKEGKKIFENFGLYDVK